MPYASQWAGMLRKELCGGKRKRKAGTEPTQRINLYGVYAYCICVTILQVALHRITVTVGRLLTVRPDCKTAGICNLRQIILSSVIIYACHIKQSTDNQCASTMYFVISEYSIALQSCQALIYRIDTKCKQCRIFCGGYTVSPGIPD